MDSGIVSNWSKPPPPVPWMIIAITFFCLFFMLVYAVVAPFQQQAMIDVVGATPLDTAVMLRHSLGDWLDFGFLALFSSLFIHASWLHLVGNLAYLWVFGVSIEQKLGALFLALVFFIIMNLRKIE